MTWAAYATFCESSIDLSKQRKWIVGSTDGRRAVYLYSVPCLALGSFGVSVSRSVSQLLFWRAFQAAGGSASMSTSVAIIGDIYKLEERGTAMGIVLSVCL